MDAFLNSSYKSWKAYCINLPRCRERRATFSEWAANIGLSFTFWDAIDKNDLADSDCHVKVGNLISKGATACRRSHEALWLHIIQSVPVEYVFIFEDDAGFENKSIIDLKRFFTDVKRSQTNWSILQFGFGTMEGIELSLLSRRNPPGIHRVLFSDETHALFLKREAVIELEKLSRDPKYKTNTADSLLLFFLHKGRGIILAPTESIITQVDSVSYIGYE
jgi:hypothetical protein